ncbi:MAG: surface antigen [Alteromonadaceae bacterium]|jgi:surface antigen|tara:strand:- start:3136 stop:3588 length:453 start_codon:yes stop_codon:yes gene_type:complete
MKTSAQVFIILLVVSLVLGCASRKETGALAGAVTGAAVGSNIGKGGGRALAIFFGAIIGSELGKAIGEHMDIEDRTRTAYVLEHNETDEISSWRNPDTANYYKVKPTRTYHSNKGPCREFTIDAQIAGKTQQLYGDACRQIDGSWQMRTH